MPGFSYGHEVTLAISVTDLGDAIEWFHDVLGFEELYQMPEIGWAEMSTPMPGVSLGLGVNEQVHAPGGATPVWAVLDVDAARRELEAKGVRFDGETQVIDGMVKLATFFDLYGNTFMLSESLMAE